MPIFGAAILTQGLIALAAAGSHTPFGMKKCFVGIFALYHAAVSAAEGARTRGAGRGAKGHSNDSDIPGLRQGLCVCE